MYRKHVLENDSEEDKNISSETSLIKEHERLTAKYNSERALLAEALKASQEENTPERDRTQSFLKEEDEEKEEDDESEIKEKDEEEEEEEEKEEKKEEADIPRFPKVVPLDSMSTDESKSEGPNVSIKKT